MILVDTAVWFDHLRHGLPDLVEMLESSQVCIHPMVLGELALGSMRQRQTVLSLLESLPKVTVASHDDVVSLIEAQRLYGRGLGLVDAHLLAATLLSRETRLWTLDKQLARAAAELGIS